MIYMLNESCFLFRSTTTTTTKPNTTKQPFFQTVVALHYSSLIALRNCNYNHNRNYNKNIRSSSLYRSLSLSSSRLSSLSSSTSPSFLRQEPTRNRHHRRFNDSDNSNSSDGLEDEDEIQKLKEQFLKEHLPQTLGRQRQRQRPTINKETITTTKRPYSSSASVAAAAVPADTTIIEQEESATNNDMPKRKSRSKSKFYAVVVGRNPGIYSTWDDCQSQVKGLSNTKFRSFSTREEAESFVSLHRGTAATTAKNTNANVDTFSNIASSFSATAQNNAASAATAQKDNPIAVVTKRRRVVAKAERTTTTTTSAKENNKKKTLAASNEEEVVETTTTTMALLDDDNNTGNGLPHKLWFHVMFDGGSRGNPHGHAGSGTHILTQKFYNNLNENENGEDGKRTSAKNAKTKAKKKITTQDDKTNVRTYLGLGLLTNNQAEYQGLVTGLEQILGAVRQDSLERRTHNGSSGGGNGASLNALTDVTIFIQGDSDLIIKQMNGVYACKSPKLKAYYRRALDLVKSIQQESGGKSKSVKCDITFEHVYRKDNKIADGLANEAMDAQKSWTTTTAPGDSGNNKNKKKKSDGANNMEV